RICQADLEDLRGRFQAAQKAYEEILTVSPENYFALNNLAWLLAHDRGTADQALKLINRAIELAEPHAEFLDTKAVALFNMGRVDEAMAIWQEIVKDPTVNRGTLASVHFHLALGNYVRGLNRDMVTELDDAQEKGLDPAKLHRLERDDYEKLSVARRNRAA